MINPTRLPCSDKLRAIGMDFAIGIGLFALILVLYLLTLAPDIADADSGEFQFVPYVLGIAHPPGYPLYTLLGKAFTLLPIGTVAYRMNLMSALFAAASVVLIYRLIGQAIRLAKKRHSQGILASGNSTTGTAALSLPLSQSTPAQVVNVSRSVEEAKNQYSNPVRSLAWPDRLVALAGSATFASSATWWTHSTVAGVRTLTGLLVALCLLFIMSWVATRKRSWLRWSVFTFGLAVTHHISLWALALPLLTIVLFSDWRLLIRPRDLLGLAPALIAGLSVTLYLPIRSALGAPFDPAHPTTLGRFLDLVMARGFGNEMFGYGWADIPRRLDVLGQLMSAQYDWWMLTIAVIGLTYSLLRVRRFLLVSGGLFLTNVAISITYRDAHTTDYLIPAYLVVATWLALGLLAIIRLADGSLEHLIARRRLILLGLSIFTLSIPASLTFANFGGQDRSRDTNLRPEATMSLRMASPTATILTDWQEATVYWYLQLAEGLRRDVNVIYVAPKGHSVPWADEVRLAITRGDVYLTDYHPEVASAFHLRPVGPLLQVLAGPDFADPGQFAGLGFERLEVTLDDKVRLMGYVLDSSSVAPGDRLHVTLYWKALQKMASDYTVFAHMESQDGKVWGQQDGYPANGHRPTSTWTKDQIVADERELMILPETAAGTYSLVAGMYEVPSPGQWRRLAVASAANQDAVELGKIAVQEVATTRAKGPLETDDKEKRTRPVNFGNKAVLTGWEIEGTPRPGHELSVLLRWDPLVRISEEASSFVHLVGPEGKMLAQHDGVPGDGSYPTVRWVPGRPVYDRHALEVDASTPPGDYQLEVGIYVTRLVRPWPVMDRLLAKQGQADRVVLGPVRISP